MKTWFTRLIGAALFLAAVTYILKLLGPIALTRPSHEMPHYLYSIIPQSVLKEATLPRL
jgi:hypothetical protein